MYVPACGHVNTSVLVSLVRLSLPGERVWTVRLRLCVSRCACVSGGRCECTCVCGCADVFMC